ncbi:MAG TPA: tautomerase family protein [Burkholderiales bacterium]|jgi:4-oxalocrotonate tautomerase|nr:tautomerase family protein [Burkholderiales bacterium]
MPHVVVKLWPGRSEEQKTKLSEAIVKDVMTHLNSSEASVSVTIEEVKQEEWTQKVYNPDIQGKWDKLYKKPGYKP